TARREELLAVADEAARAIAQALGGEGAGAGPRDAPLAADALELYVRARQLYARFSRDTTFEALSLLRDARARAPGHPLVESGLALALTRASFFESKDAEKLLAEARVAAAQALERAPHLGEPHLAAGQLALHMGDAPAAARAFRVAIAQAPSLAEAHLRLGYLLLEAGEDREGRRRVEVATSL